MGVEIEKAEVWIHSFLNHLADIHRFGQMRAMQREPGICHLAHSDILQLFLPDSWKCVGPIEGASSSQLGGRWPELGWHVCIRIVLSGQFISPRRLKVAGRPRILELVVLPLSQKLRWSSEGTGKRLVIDRFPSRSS